eukprot:TRINITY_DN991_c0_g1_i1.p3 TRINITY_DN991_c0_g1~~TRINITY_DN991_c0_g1_i1.p3  ORF type:complete len:122 (+),score=27.78 TRINITY_DN991_c0_g1_i1:103-468(+)
MLRSLVGSEMCIRDSINAEYGVPAEANNGNVWAGAVQGQHQLHPTARIQSTAHPPATRRAWNGTSSPVPGPAAVPASAAAAATAAVPATTAAAAAIPTPARGSTGCPCELDAHGQCWIVPN